VYAGCTGCVLWAGCDVQDVQDVLDVQDVKDLQHVQDRVCEWSMNV